MARPAQKVGYGHSSSYSLEPEENHEVLTEQRATGNIRCTEQIKQIPCLI